MKATTRRRLRWLQEGDLSGPWCFYLERRRVRCGKAGCGCARRPHGPYFYLRVTEDGRRRRIYVPRRSAWHVRRWAAEFRDDLGQMRAALSLVAI